jgi:hypothetical protein
MEQVHLPGWPAGIVRNTRPKKNAASLSASRKYVKSLTFASFWSQREADNDISVANAKCKGQFYGELYAVKYRRHV